MPWAVRAVVETFPEPRPGDVFLLNDPYHGGSHLPDLTAFVPVFGGGRPLLWSVVRAHIQRYRRLHPWRLQPGCHGNLAGGPAGPADPPDRGRRAAGRPAGHAGRQHPAPTRLPRRPVGDDRRGAAGRERVGAVLDEQSGLEARDGGHAGRRRAAQPVRSSPNGGPARSRAPHCLTMTATARPTSRIRARVTVARAPLRSTSPGPTRNHLASSTRRTPTCSPRWRWRSPSCSTPTAQERRRVPPA